MGFLYQCKIYLQRVSGDAKPGNHSPDHYYGN